VRVTAIEGHRAWASGYDSGLNPLLALETRRLAGKFGSLHGCRFLDLACGTGRWMQIARDAGARALGVDFCVEMLVEASRKPGLAGCLGVADLASLPIRGHVADVTLCSFALGYLPAPERAISEMARVTRVGGRIVISDLHPDALAAGWTRSFRSGGEVYEIDHHAHPAAAWETSAASAGLKFDWRLDARFDEPEREIFRQAGKDSSFDEVRRVSAILAMSWTKP
jgi:malonyl-CoA O-methyltransferase